MQSTTATPPQDALSSHIAFFQDLSGAEQLFDSFRSELPTRTAYSGAVIGSLWYHLSEAIVDILCIALAKLKNPAIRHLVVQTAYEELGEDSLDKLHTKMLREMLHLAGVTDTDILRWSGHEGVNKAIRDLKADLLACTCDAEICGILLGMEIIAYENVDNVVDYVSHSDDVAAAVRGTEWVQLHHQLEEGHIRRAVSVFVDHMPDLSSQRRCVETFARTMRFWEQFWQEIAVAARPTTA